MYSLKLAKYTRASGEKIGFSSILGKVNHKKLRIKLLKLKQFLILVKKIVSFRICFTQNLTRIYVTLNSLNCRFYLFHREKYDVS